LQDVISMTRARAAMLPDGRRLHLQDGPIDLVIEAFGPAEAVRAAYAAAIARFDGLLDELCSELPLLRAAARPDGTALTGVVARRMYAAVAEHVVTAVSVSAEAPAAEPASAIPPLGVIPGLVPGTHSSPGSQASRLPGRSVGSRHEAGNDFGEGSDLGEATDVGEASDLGAGGAVPDDALFITPMAAVAGAVADEILAAMLAAGAAGGESDGAEAGGQLSRSPSARTQLAHPPPTHPPLSRVYVNNGGDIALHLAPGERLRVGLVDRPDRPSLDASALFARTELSAEDGVGGIATSGWRGRSFSLGIADAVTVLAATAAAADAAATVIANAVDLPGHPAIVRAPARDLAPDSDLGDRRVTRAVGALSAGEIDAALSAGVAVAEGLVRCGLITGAALHLAGATRIVGIRLARVVGDARPAAQLAPSGPSGVGALAG
jgi:ApbE superfamily uncharacterized protein (UPF0280 family)